jgi:hypothetical protein
MPSLDLTEQARDNKREETQNEQQESLYFLKRYLGNKMGKMQTR